LIAGRGPHTGRLGHHVAMGGRPVEVRLGRSDVRISPFGLGTAPLGGLFRSVDDGEATALVRHALDLGITTIDTAPLYGHGRAEQRVGAALHGVDRDRFVLSTKVGRLVVPREGADTGMFVDAEPSVATWAYDADSVRRSLDASLERLGLDRVDVVLVHDPDDHVEEALGVTYPVLHRLRDEGMIGAIGVGMNQPTVPTRFVRETDIDVVLLAGRYTLLDQSGARDLLPAALARGVSVLIGGVFNSGVLADPSPGPASTFDYLAAPPAVLDRVARLARVCAAHGVDLPTAALAFPWRHPAVASVLLGVRSCAELDQALARAATVVPEGLWTDLVAEGLVDDPHG
jgi:D-threo-aldose 1-dehydrogenase